jgi:hypothetical protein
MLLRAQISEEQVMINATMSACCLMPVVRNSVQTQALLSKTSFRAHDVTPERKRLGKVCKFCAIACLTLGGPMRDFVEVINPFESFQYRRGLRPPKAIQTEVLPVLSCKWQ